METECGNESFDLLAKAWKRKAASIRRNLNYIGTYPDGPVREADVLNNLRRQIFQVELMQHYTCVLMEDQNEHKD